MKTNEVSRMGLKRMSAESRCAVAKPSIPIAIDGYDVKIFTDNIEETALRQIKELLSIDVFSDKKKALEKIIKADTRNDTALRLLCSKLILPI